jgi:hypothetical protein
MRAPMKLPPLLASLLLLCCSSGCGKEIGDECVLPSDCSPNGDRQCLDPNSGNGGYCTIQGCDFNTCPEEAVCVRFFTGGFANKPCDPDLEDLDPANDLCSFDELCSLAGTCVPRSSEIRFCMRRCESSGDCREGYECRNLELMIQHGGEPVLDRRVDESAPRFCALAPV